AMPGTTGTQPTAAGFAPAAHRNHWGGRGEPGRASFPAPFAVQSTVMERLNKYLAHAGVGSRRHCDTLIAAGRVKVDGVPVTDLGLKIDPEAHKVSLDDHPVTAEKPVYWAV